MERSNLTPIYEPDPLMIRTRNRKCRSRCFVWAVWACLIQTEEWKGEVGRGARVVVYVMECYS